MNPGQEARLEALRNYLRAVTRDLLMRGVIRRQQGQSLDAILSAELQTVLAEVSADFGAVLKDLGVGLLQGFASLVTSALMPRR